MEQSPERRAGDAALLDDGLAIVPGIQDAIGHSAATASDEAWDGGRIFADIVGRGEAAASPDIARAMSYFPLTCGWQLGGAELICSSHRSRSSRACATCSRLFFAAGRGSRGLLSFAACDCRG